MILLQILEGKTYDKFNTIQELNDFITDTTCDVHDLGQASDGNTIYGLSVGNLNKPMIYFDAQIHGLHEWGTTHWMKQFIEIINNPPNSVAEKIEKLKSDFCIFVIPCLNPYGYLNSSYVNANGVNLNRNFPVGFDDFDDNPKATQYKGEYPFSEPEALIVKNVVETYNVLAYANCHTKGSGEGATIVTPSTNPEGWIMGQDIADTMRGSLPAQRTAYGSTKTLGTPWVIEWVGSQSNNSNGQIFAFTYESGQSEPKETQATLGINALLAISLHTQDWFKNRRLIYG